MMNRRGFVGIAAAVMTAGAARPRAALALVETSSGAPGPHSDTGRATLDAIELLVATQPHVRTVWRPPSRFPQDAPFAYYAGRGGDQTSPNDPAIWLNPDHPELVSPRVSRLTDEIPLTTELLLASVDVRPTGAPSVGLENVAPEKRRMAATELAGRVAVVARYTPFPAVDDAEFERRGFAFAVLRQMTPEIGGVSVFEAPAKLAPGEAAAYAGRDADRRAPRGWGVVYENAALVERDRAGYESWLRAFVLATADRQPPDSRVRWAYEAARAKDEAAGGWTIRRAFAAPYVSQVAALFGR